MLYDTTFLIHLSGQRGQAGRSAAASYLAEHGESAIYTSRVCWSEFAEGCPHRDLVEKYLQPFFVVEIDEDIAWEASRIARRLDKQGLPIGDNDIWIAATASVFSLPLVTRNSSHFGRVPGLKLEEY